MSENGCMVSRSGVKKVWIFEARSENGCVKWHFLVWNWVWIWRGGRHTPTKNFKEYPSPRFVLLLFTNILKRDLASILFTFNRNVTITLYGSNFSNQVANVAFSSPFDQYQESRPLGRSNTEVRFHEHSVKSDKYWLDEIRKQYSAHAQKSCPARTFFKRSRDSWKKRGL